MTDGALTDYPDRYALSNELHARPFPELTAPCCAAYIAIKQPHDAAERDREADRAHLLSLLDHYGAPHPAPGANHHSCPLGRGFLKWEQHTEFVTYTIFASGVAARPFDGSVYGMFNRKWLADAPGQVLTSCLVRVEPVADMAEAQARITSDLYSWFVPESLAISSVIDGAAAIAGDFRIDESGHVRFAVLVNRQTGARRLGRIVQRLLEIETYKSAAMLTLPVARATSARVRHLNRELTDVVARMEREEGGDVDTLRRLLKMSAEIELLSSSSAFRFGASGAYEAIVTQRIEVLREERLQSRQTFAEFMMRRFDPAMRTCRAAEAQLAALSQRAERAANLLRTRVDVASSQQNVDVLARMDERAALQLRLQETVEGLSVVAISYYGVSLVVNLLKPFAKTAGIGEAWVYAGVTLPVILLVWYMIRRLKKKLGH
ncbi:DUF3422 family protein [Algicella marina]|uniref:DUF3422 family protein n=1 Tax=Algicella marina TaxID=2683284 RepID=A0A6P1T3A9_9RHOB|nr:DUF3422 domain-containing protein [Algicella marina]QHQ35946.1 DUF3422 family protein [Algicella marina]